MIYEDEIGSTETLDEARRKAYTQDLERFIGKFEKLQNEETQKAAYIKSLEDQLQISLKEAKQAKRRVVALSNESTQHKLLISALRGSKSMRLGRMISKSSVVVRKLGPYRYVISKISQRIGAVNGVTANTVVAPDLVAAVTPAAHFIQRDPSMIYADLNANFRREPTKENLLKLLSHHYFVRGDLTVPSDLIGKHQEILTALSGSEKTLLDKILGHAALLNVDVALPPVQPNAGYLPERGRVMYCVHSTGDFDSNGYSTRTTGLVSGLSENGQDLVVVARPGYPWDTKKSGRPVMDGRLIIDHGDVPFIYTPGPSISKGRLDHFVSEAADVIAREAIRNRVAVIHSASNHLTALPALIAARRLGIPFVYEVRGLWEITEMSLKPSWQESDRFKLSVKLESLVANESDHILAITSQVAATLIERGATPSKITILPNAVDTNVFTPMPPYAELRNALNLDDKNIVLGYAGSIVDYEGLSVLLDAVKILIDRSRNVRVVIVGDGPELDSLKRQAKILAIDDMVHFTGRVPAADVPKYMSIFDIMPCPRLSVPVTELVSPIKPLEIMASGTALILSDLAPSRDLAGPSEMRALLAVPGDSRSLADTIDRLIVNTDLRRNMEVEARLWTVAARTWTRIAMHAIDAYLKAAKPSEQRTGRALSELNVAIIADEFTLSGIRPEVQTIELEPDRWLAQISSSSVDLLFVESAWSGNGGKWRGKVGYYDDDSFSELKALVAHCRRAGIPTVFWNKEDPVHFNRFETTASQFEYIFTTDSSCIPKYESLCGLNSKAVASLPFYAQPKLQNPLPGNRAYVHTVAYGGSYYGDKYKKRSKELLNLLRHASESGLTIYDRQHLNADSPYKFPESLQKYVVGGLSYEEMLNAYKAHPVHINVNSVDSSPTMFSRRVVEVAASGSAVLSGTGQGVSEVLNGLVPVISDSDDAALLISAWMSNEKSRVRDAWRAYRAVYRSHTAAHRLSYVFRTAGLQIEAPSLPDFAIFVPELNQAVIRQFQSQTSRPSRIFFGSSVLGDEVAFSCEQASDFSDAKRHAASDGIGWIANVTMPVEDRTMFEDLLVPNEYGTWTGVSISERNLDQRGLGIATYEIPDADDVAMVTTRDADIGDSWLALRRPISHSQTFVESTIKNADSDFRKTLLVAGHDLKFATGIIDEFRRRGHEVLIDKWDGHNQHDLESSRALLAKADVVLCEWSLGNAAWYSNNVQEGQRLVVRLHFQEISTQYLNKTNFANIDKMIFVGRHIADIAVRDFDVPEDIVQVIPNYVNVTDLDREKSADSKWNIGFVGIVPQRKRLDLALDFLTDVRAHDDRFRLFIKGHRPEQYSWMKDRPEEMQFYKEQYDRIETDPRLKGAVIFEPFDDDMPGWYSKIGTVISVSDYESFHLTLADGAASRALAMSLAWDGADQIYPTEWLGSTVKAISDRLLEATADTDLRSQRIDDAYRYVEEHFESGSVLSTLYDTIVGEASLDALPG